MRFAAPPETGSITLATGVFQVEDGHVTVPDDLISSDVESLRANGFTRAADTPAPLDLTGEQADAAADHEG